MFQFKSNLTKKVQFATVTPPADDILSKVNENKEASKTLLKTILKIAKQDPTPKSDVISSKAIESYAKLESTTSLLTTERDQIDSDIKLIKSKLTSNSEKDSVNSLDLAGQLQNLELKKAENERKAIDLNKMFDEWREEKNQEVDEMIECVENEHEERIYEENRIAQSVDLCFMIDTTGSMGPYMELVKEKMVDIVDQVKSSFAESGLNVGICSYKDIGDIDRFEIKDFSNLYFRIKLWLASVRARGGGGDGAEDVNGAFQKTLKMSWKSKIRYIFHIADAPCHGSEYNTKHRDRFKEGYLQDRPYEEIFKELIDKQINYCFMRINKCTDKMMMRFESIFRRVSLYNKNDLHFGQNTIQAGQGHHFVSTITSMLNSSLITSVTQVIMGQNDEFKKRIRVNGLQHIEEQKIKEYLGPNEDDEDEVIEKNEDLKPKNYSLTKSIREIMFSKDVDKTMSFTSEYYSYFRRFDYESDESAEIFRAEDDPEPIKIKFKTYRKAFEEGAFSRAHYALVTPLGHCNSFEMVIKVNKGNIAKIHFRTVIELMKNAEDLAEKFNKALDLMNENPENRVHFINLMLLKYKGETFLLEPYIRGKYEKYTNNTQYVNEYVPLMSCFSHFTYQLTKKKMMICDLQGVNNILTDPSIHTYNKYFKSLGDNGGRGFAEFFARHECGSYCKKLNLRNHKKRGMKITKKFVNFSPQVWKKCKNLLCNRSSKEDNEFCEVCVRKE